MADENPDERDQRRARERQHDRAETVERVLEDTGTLEDLRDHKYPVSSEELSAAYGDQSLDLPNETESLGSAFDRLDEEYDSPEEAREAVYGELTGEQMDGTRDVDVGAAAEANEERELREIAEEVERDAENAESPYDGAADTADTLDPGEDRADADGDADSPDVEDASER
jgi:hypothetical protein